MIKVVIEMIKVVIDGNRLFIEIQMRTLMLKHVQMLQHKCNTNRCCNTNRRCNTNKMLQHRNERTDAATQIDAATQMQHEQMLQHRCEYNCCNTNAGKRKGLKHVAETQSQLLQHEAHDS